MDSFSLSLCGFLEPIGEQPSVERTEESALNARSWPIDGKKELSKFIIFNMVSVARSKQDLLNSPCKNPENLLRKTNIP